MSRTLDEIAYLYLSSVNKITDDSDLDIRLMKSWIRTTRAVWVKNELNKNKPISLAFIQSLGIVNLELVDIAECDVPVEFKILRSNVDIPDTIETMFEPTISRIGPAILTSAKYALIAYERVPYIGNGRFSDTAIFTFFKDKRIYIISKGDGILKNAMRKIYISAVLANPEDASTFKLGNSQPCYTSASAYPITEYLIAYMKDIVINIDFKTFEAGAPDEINNVRDDYKLTAGLPQRQVSRQAEGQQQRQQEEG